MQKCRMCQDFVFQEFTPITLIHHLEIGVTSGQAVSIDGASASLALYVMVSSGQRVKVTPRCVLLT